MAGTRGGRGRNGAKAANDDGFDQGGPDGPKRRAREAANDTVVLAIDDKGKGEGHNSRVYDGEALKSAIEVIRAEEAAIDAKMDAAKKACEGHRATIKATKKGLVTSGFASEVLAVVLRKDKLQRRIETIDSELDDEQKDQFASMEEALGEYLDTELGRAAARAEASAHAPH